MPNIDAIKKRTIQDFGDQWTHFTENDGYYGSAELLKDILGPLMPPESIRGKTVVEIGSGTGRIVNMLLDLGAAEVVAIEPSAGVDALRRNTEARKDQVTIQQIRGDQLHDENRYDLIVSIGVIHHIIDPAPVLNAAWRALKPGGKLLIWVYGHEGNELYLATFGRLRAVTTKLPHVVLLWISSALNVAAGIYVALCRVCPLPMRRYALDVFGKMSWPVRRLVIYDQLNPTWARYYRRQEAVQLLEDARFKNVTAFHRHRYSWTVTGEK